MKRIDGRDIYNFHKCKWRVYLDKNGTDSNKEPVDHFIEMLWSGDKEHATALSYLEKQPDRSLVSISKKSSGVSDSYSTRARETMMHMKNGEHFIYGGVISKDGEHSLFTQSPQYIAEPDILMRVNGSSNLGEYTYVPVNIKSGKGLDENDWGERLTPGYLAELSFYGLLLEDILKTPVKEGYILNGENSFVKYPLAYHTPAFKKTLEEIIAMATGKNPHDREPVISSICGICHWQKNCQVWADEHSDLTLMFYLGEKVKYGFYDLGIKNLHDLAQANPEDLIARVQLSKKRGGFYPSFNDALIRKLIVRAQLFVKEKKSATKKNYILRRKPNFPEAQKEIHYDIEDDPIHGFVYMHGFWIREQGKEPYYHAIIAKRGETEAEVAQRLWTFFQENENIPIYHYSPHERHTCKKLMEKYALDPKVYNRVFGINGSAVDLYEWIVENTDWPLTSYGLKAICKYTGFRWSADDAGGANSVSWYAKYLQGDESMLEKILIYNKEDCMATAHLKDWLINNS